MNDELITVPEDSVDFLEHYGILRRSGRYPYGSGGDLIAMTSKMSSEGLTEKEISTALGITIKELRDQKTIAKAMVKEEQRIRVNRERDNGVSYAQIGRDMGIAESTVRSLHKSKKNLKLQIIEATAKILRFTVEKFGYVDIGVGTEQFMGISGTKLSNAVSLLKMEGFKVYYLREPQLGTDKLTSYKILAGPDSEFKDVYANRTKLAIPNEPSYDGGRSFLKSDTYGSIDPSRVHVVYGKDGGRDKDGMMELRRGVESLSLGRNTYAQVRIGVGDGHFLKGMAVHGDNLPEGKDIVFYTNKNPTGNDLDALKPLKVGGVSPFGSNVRKHFFIDKDGNTKQSTLNIVNEQGDWQDWSSNLSSQVLSKQSPKVTKGLLKQAYDVKKMDYDEIMLLENPVLKQHLLQEFSDSADSAAVHLKAASLPRQSTAVLLPVPSIKPTEIYAPRYNDGERVALIRYPHGGIFEIPELIVNNKNRSAKSMIGNAADAIGINPATAGQLAGADFDGDTALVIPNNNRQILSSKPLKGLKDFDPINSYPRYEGMKLMTPRQKQRQMGDVSNLITDMTIKGASPDEIARAVRHSMVVIDAEKHKLNWRQSRIDNGIPALKKKYQGSARSGASTLVSRASSEERVNERRQHVGINPRTGEKEYKETGRSYIRRKTMKDGTVKETKIFNQTKSTKMAEAKDAYELIDGSGTAIERVYADHANKLKSLGNQARLSMIKTKPHKYSPATAVKYKKELTSLDNKLKLAKKNAPLERRAQLIGGHIYKERLRQNPDMSTADKKKERGRALVVARTRVGAEKPRIKITPREWEAIQLGGVTKTRLQEILLHTDADEVRTYATPKTTPTMSTSKVSRAKQLLNAGYTIAEVSHAVGVSQSQIANIEND